MNFLEITYSQLKNSVETFLRKEYDKVGEVYSSVASPYGQVLHIVYSLFELSILYLKRAIGQFDIRDEQNPQVTDFTALIAGHNKTRATSASGTLQLKLKNQTNVADDIAQAKITISNRLTVKNETNGLDYTVDLGGSDRVTYDLTRTKDIYVNIIQGRWVTSTLTGNGEKSQTYRINTENNKSVEQFNYQLKVNGQIWEPKKHLWDILENEEAYVVTTDLNGGAIIIFGNENFGKVPQLGDRIDFSYIESDGSAGNIFRRTINDWSWDNTIFDGNGETINVNNFFDTFIMTDINFGSDGESSNYTRTLLPLSTNNYVLALPRHYAYYIKRLGVFSHVNAYLDENDVIRVVATPNIKLFKEKNIDYFNLDDETFILDDYEKNKIDQYLKAQGTIRLTQRYEITAPTLKYYVVNIYVRPFEGSVETSISDQIYDIVSDFFLSFNRVDRISKKDLLVKISEISEIDSVDLNFKSKENEDYHRTMIEKIRRTNPSSTNTKINYDRNKALGLDPKLGDIVFKENEFPVLKGGWIDRNRVFYNRSLNSGFGPINIYFKGKTPLENKQAKQ